ncbi:hypothetical protein [Thermogemmatispora sp.]|uniref:hypothetical protein n=1 Tax=Thermogemmatispora sp. TaxID=1968838 RepID=UPI0035E4465D
MVISTLLDNVRMRFDLYYFTNSHSAAEGLREQQQTLTMLARKGTARDRRLLLLLLSHLYRLEGLIARDDLNYPMAETCFQQASLLAQEAECPELDALSLACRAVLFVRQQQATIALQCYEAACAIARRSSPALKAYLAIGAAEAQSMLRETSCLRTLEQAHRWLRQMDPADDPLLLYRSTRCSEQTLLDCSLMCQAALGRYEPALDYYSDIDQRIDLSMPRRKARLLIQCAKLLYQNRDMSCCFYATEGFRIAKRIDSHYNMQQARELATVLKARLPADPRVQELAAIIEGLQ